MNQRQLQYFVALAEELHFVRAADRLHVTQSALSQQIARLEEIVGARLFTRAHRQVELTQAGRSFLEETRPLLRNMELAVTLARRAAEGHSGRLRIGFADAAALNVLPDLISSFTQLYPGVKLVLHEMISQHQVEALHAGRIDVGLLRPVFPKGELSWLLLLREPYVVALARTHPLASQKAVSIGDLRLETFITTSREKSRYVDSRFRGAFHKAGFHPSIGQEVNELHAILSLVASGLGVALFPASVVGLALKDLVYRPINSDESPTAELVLAWREDQDIATARHFIDVAGRLVDARVRTAASPSNPPEGFPERDTRHE